MLKYFKDNAKKYVFQEEDEGTKHLQGFVEFKNQKSFQTLKGIFPIHWEKTKSVIGSQNYCSREDKRKGQIWSVGMTSRRKKGIEKVPVKISDPLLNKSLQTWQKDYQVCSLPVL